VAEEREAGAQDRLELANSELEAIPSTCWTSARSCCRIPGLPGSNSFLRFACPMSSVARLLQKP